MTILITGGAGALGSYLVKKYLAEGNRVIVLDNLMKTQTTENIDAFLGNSNFKFIKHDINDPIELTNEKIDWIFNAACPVSCISLQIDPIHTVKSCTLGVINMLELARKHNAKFLQCSSADIYGEMKGEPFKETDYGSTNTLSPRACYEEGKRTAETLCMDYHRKYGVEVKIARIFNTAGPHTQMTDGRVPSIFIYNALAQRPLRIYGDGQATRCFLHVEDQIDGLDKFMRTGFEVTGPVNIGSTQEITIKELAEKIIQKTGSRSEIIYEKRDDAPILRRPDTTLAHNLLNWHPTKTLDELLDDMIAHYKTKGLPESTVLVFSVTYFPDHGPAEAALIDLADKMRETEFHIITSKMHKNRRSVEHYDNVTVYRVGLGTKYDKYLLPILGSFKAINLNKKYHYRFMWSVMASYGGLIGIFLKLLGNKASFILLQDEKQHLTGWKKKLALFVQSRSDSVYSTDTEHDGQFIDNLRKTYAELTAKQENKLLRPL